MPYLDIVFHNIRSSLEIIANGEARYISFPQTVNVGQGHDRACGGGNSFPAYGYNLDSATWGGSVTGIGPAAIFLCESPPYPSYPPAAWRVPALRNGHIAAGLHPYNALNKLCAFFDGTQRAAPAVVLVPPAHPAQLGDATWFGGASGVRCLGTGALAPGGLAPAGSDRYAILFAAEWCYDGGPAVTGVFAHTKNTQACPGTQLAALCREFPGEIIFGDLNLDLRHPYKEHSLRHAVGGTHTVLTLREGDGPSYFTHYTALGEGSSTLDFALVPNARVADVELWAHRPSASRNLTRNGSDHSVMMLRVRCV